MFDKIETNAPRTIFAGKCKTRLMLKGRLCEAYTEASYASFLDTDTDLNADFDIVSVVECEELSYVAFIDVYVGGERLYSGICHVSPMTYSR